MCRCGRSWRSPTSASDLRSTWGSTSRTYRFLRASSPSTSGPPLLKLEKVTKLTVIIFLIPVITLAYGVVTSGVVPSYLTVAGIALIFVGIYASNILGHRGEEPTVRPAGGGPRAQDSAADQHPS